MTHYVLARELRGNNPVSVTGVTNPPAARLNSNIANSASNYGGYGGYGNSASNYGNSNSNYGTSSSNYGTSASNYGTSANNYGTSSRSYGNTASNNANLGSQLSSNNANAGGNYGNYGNYANRPTLAPPQDEELVKVPSMGSFAVARSLSSQLQLDTFELRNMDDDDSYYEHERGGPSPAPSHETMDSTNDNNHGMVHMDRGYSRGYSEDDKHYLHSDDKHYSRRSSDEDPKLASVEGEEKEDEVSSGVLSGYRLFFVFLSLLLCTFVSGCCRGYSCRMLTSDVLAWCVVRLSPAGLVLTSPDQSIVATAIPVIVSDFNSFAAVAWLVTAYFVRLPLPFLANNSSRNAASFFWSASF